MSCDFLIIGSGIAAASIGYWLAPHGRVTLLERESQPGYHSTGRSAALFLASYGTPQVRALTLASRAFLDHPPDGFAEAPILSPRGALFVATPEQAELLDEHCALLQALSPQSRRLSREQTLAMVPVLRGELLLGGAYEPDACDIDVHALHQGYLKGVRRHGGTLVCDAEATAIERHAGPMAGAGRRTRTPRAGVDQCGRRLVRRGRAARRRAHHRPGAQAPLGLHLRAAAGPGRGRLAQRGRGRRVLVLQARRRHAARLARQCRPGAARRTCSPRSWTSRWASTASRP